MEGVDVSDLEGGRGVVDVHGVAGGDVTVLRLRRVERDRVEPGERHPEHVPGLEVDSLARIEGHVMATGPQPLEHLLSHERVGQATFLPPQLQRHVSARHRLDVEVPFSDGASFPGDLLVRIRNVDSLHPPVGLRSLYSRETKHVRCACKGEYCKTPAKHLFALQLGSLQCALKLISSPRGECAVLPLF